MTDPVAVTGIGAVTPLGVGASVLYERVLAGETGLLEGAGRCDQAAIDALLSRREVKRNARFSQLAMVAAHEAARQAGWSTGLPYPAEDVMCLIGTGLGGADSLGGETSALTVPLTMPNSAAASLSMRLGLRGESFAVCAACAAGTQAIGHGLRAIRRGDAAAAVVGGAEAPLIPPVRDSFDQAGALSPTRRCVPFGADRDGFVMGEGAGVLVLEDLDRARDRGAEVLGVIRGYGASSDAHHLTSPAPGAGPAAEAMRRALADAGLAADDICYVNAHGTGTVLNDENEAEAMRAVFGPRRVPVSSTKAATGHLFGAGGAVEAIVTLLALRHGMAPPTRGLTEPDPSLADLDHVLTARSLPAGMAGMSTSLGFGGHNAVLTLAAA